MKNPLDYFFNRHELHEPSYTQKIKGPDFKKLRENCDDIAGLFEIDEHEKEENKKRQTIFTRTACSG